MENEWGEDMYDMIRHDDMTCEETERKCKEADGIGVRGLALQALLLSLLEVGGFYWWEGLPLSIANL